MAQRDTNASFVPGASTERDVAGISLIEVVAIVLSLLWLLGATLFFVFMPADSGAAAGPATGDDRLRFIITLMAIFMPVGMIWVAAAASRSARIMREESRRLHTAIDAMRQTYVAERQARGTAVQPTVERKLAEIAQSAKQTETTLATFATRRDQTRRPALTPASPEVSDDQPSLALGTAVEDFLPPIDRPDLIRALKFPDTERDEDGFAALRRALKDRQSRQVVQASQDVLTLLSQDGIYMDDMRPDQARPEIWRRFAKGERGRSVAALGGIRDRSSMALTAGRMREDIVFRDAAHHFLRKFDQLLVAFEPEASDEDLVDLSNTRTARAFMLLGRVTGAFD